MHSGKQSSLDRITICIPVYNDWDSLLRLLKELDGCLSTVRGDLHVLVVDDNSEVPPPNELFKLQLHRLGQVRLLTLRRNLGHQRAIAIALCTLWAEQEPSAVLVMDGDGEDAPLDTVRLISAFREGRGEFGVFAARARRAESLSFRVAYKCYRLVHKLLTGLSVKVGNFSILPWEHVETLVVAPELWSHYAATVVKCKIPIETIRADRQRRYAGSSQMNLVALVIHGLAAISVYADIVGVRLLLAALALLTISSAALAATVAIRVFTDLAIAGWATSAAGLLVVMNFQAVLIAIVFAFIALFGRNARTSPPISDFRLLLSRNQKP